MFEEPNKKTLNHYFEKIGNYEYESRPATKKEIEEARRDFKEGNYEMMALGRSCWECNKAHVHLIDKPAMNCFSCGRVYHKGYDITDYSDSELEEYVEFAEEDRDN